MGVSGAGKVADDYQGIILSRQPSVDDNESGDWHSVDRFYLPTGTSSLARGMLSAAASSASPGSSVSLGSPGSPVGSLTVYSIWEGLQVQLCSRSRTRI